MENITIPDSSVTGCLGCNRMEIATVTLRDGRVVCDQCEDWRAECEARYVVGMKSDVDRSTYINAVRRKRGMSAALALRAMAKQILGEQR